MHGIGRSAVAMARITQITTRAQVAESLHQALLRRTRFGGLTYTRAGIFDYFEHVHHYFGCPEDDSA
jgi:hypothetical protein